MTDTPIIEQYSVKGMSCASCATSLASHLSFQKGVEDIHVNYANTSAIITFNPNYTSIKKLRKAANEIGFDLLSIEQYDHVYEQSIRFAHLKKNIIIAAIFSIPVFIISMFLQGILPLENWIQLVLSTPVVFYAGREFISNAIKRAIHFDTNMDSLVALSTQVAFWYSAYVTLFSSGEVDHVYFESSVVIITFILLGKYLEERAKNKASEAIKKLASLRAKSVIVLNQNGLEENRSMEEVKYGDLIVIKPGERIPVDGIIDTGYSYVNEQMITGEPIPVFKKKNDQVKSGTINQDGQFILKAEQIGSETLLSNIVKMVEEAQGSKPPIQSLADKIASVFVPIVILIAIISFLAWYYIIPGSSFQFAIQIFVAVLIVACPCALGLATPTSLIVGMGRGATLGILIRNGESLEEVCKTDVLVLDKTGTLTEGTPKVNEVIWNTPGNKEEYTSVLVSLEQQSTHPLAKAVTSHFYSAPISKLTDVNNVPGKGISGVVKGKNFHVGSMKFMKALGLDISKELTKEIEEVSKLGKSIVLFGDEKNVLSMIALSDNLKPEANKFIKKIKALGIKTFMLTGDNETVAKAVSTELKLNGYQANVLSTEKGKFIEKEQQKGNYVTMVGDGINDAHALAKANVGIAMASGSDIAKESAGITLLNSDLNQISRAINLSKFTLSNIKQNLFFSFVYNIVAIPIAAGILFPFFGILLNPMIAGAAMAMSSVTVVSNSLRLKRKNLN